MGVIAGARKVTAGSAMGSRKVARALYDFGTDGGATGTINLRGDRIPNDALVVNAFTRVNTAPTSGGAATIRLDSEASGDLQAATAMATAPFTAGGHQCTPFASAGTRPVTTSDMPIKMVIATAALTAGKFSVVVEYYELASQT